VKIELKILDPRLPGWGFPGRGSDLAAGLDLHACLGARLVLKGFVRNKRHRPIFGLRGTVAPERRIVPR
jgi:hypothetical protein